MAALALAAVGGTLVQTGVAPEEKTNITSLVTSGARGPRLQKCLCMGQDPKSQAPGTIVTAAPEEKTNVTSLVKSGSRGPEAAEMHSTKTGRKAFTWAKTPNHWLVKILSYAITAL